MAGREIFQIKKQLQDSDIFDLQGFKFNCTAIIIISFGSSKTIWSRRITGALAFAKSVSNYISGPVR